MNTNIVLILCCLLTTVYCSKGHINGTVTVFATFKTGQCHVHVKIFKQHTSSKGAILGQNIGTLYLQKPLETVQIKVETRETDRNIQVKFSSGALPLQPYFIVAEVEGAATEHNVMGWYTSEKCSWLSTITLDATNPTRSVNIDARGSTPPTTPLKIENGELKFEQNVTVVRLRGDEKQRGYAHGYLLAQQIIDFFRFFSLHSDIRSCSLYTNKYVPMIQNSLSGNGGPFSFSKELLAEVDAIIQGMKANKNVDIYFPELGRDFSRVELLAINSYIEFEYLAEQSSDTNRGACSQFALWNTQTIKNEELQGGIIGGRNMDGEIDIRHVTVSHFVMFAIEPSQGKKYVSFMWPGFVGTLSAINEDGVYTMMNFGVSSSTSVVYQNATPVSWIVRDMMVKPKSADDATPENMQKIIEKYNAASGGPCVAGCVLFIMKPYHKNTVGSPSFVYEGDWKQGFMRLPGMADPFQLNDAILATNHFNVYGVDPDLGPMYNFGRYQSFSSLWRYTAGNSKVQGYSRSPITQGRVGVEQLAELLRTVQHGSTEHAIIYNPLVDQHSGKLAQIVFHVALASTDRTTAWDAPYLGFLSFDFNSLFK